MDKFQAEQAADALISSASQEREELRSQRAVAAFAQHEKRKIAWAGLAGFAIGAITAHYLQVPIVRGGFWGTMLLSLPTTVWVLISIQKHHKVSAETAASAAQKTDFE